MRITPRSRQLGLGLAAGIGLGALALGIGRRRVAAAIDGHVDRVEAASRQIEADPYGPDDLAGLPVPIHRYLETVLDPGQPHVEAVRLSQTGEIRLGDGDPGWRAFEATGTYSVSPPAYAWDADVAIAPLVSARVLDAYVEGEGRLRASLLGAVPVASAGPDPAMNEAELQRYLAETPWFPTALLPAAGITWEELDDERARATIVDGDVTASAVFHVDDAGHVVRVTADRYRQDTGERAPWIGTYRAYERRSGMTIPTGAEVAWDGPADSESYWRGRVTSIDYRTGGATPGTSRLEE